MVDIDMDEEGPGAVTFAPMHHPASEPGGDTKVPQLNRAVEP